MLDILRILNFILFVRMWLFNIPFRHSFRFNSRSASASSNHSADVIVQYTNNVSPETTCFLPTNTFLLEIRHKKKQRKLINFDHFSLFPSEFQQQSLEPKE